jgi:hypothetical protein
VQDFARFGTSVEWEESLMRRSAILLAALALALPALASVTVGSADGDVQGRARPDPGLPRHRRHPEGRRGGVVTAPPNNVCRSRRDFTIHIVQIKGLTYRQVSVYVNDRSVNVVRGARISAPVDLRGLPKGRYVVRITVTTTTTTGRRITGTRAYHTCAPKPLHPRGQPRL